MNMLRIICLFFAVGACTAAFAADPTGLWKWATPAPNGVIETTLKLESKDGKLVGAYSNQFGATEISNVSFHDDVIAFDVVREFGGNQYVVKYHGKLEGDTIMGTLEAPGHDGSHSLKLDWNAKRSPNAGESGAKPKA